MKRLIFPVKNGGQELNVWVREGQGQVGGWRREENTERNKHTSKNPFRRL